MKKSTAHSLLEKLADMDADRVLMLRDGQVFEEEHAAMETT